MHPTGEQHVALCIATDAHGRILFGRRNDNHLYVIPGGHVDPGESPEAAALRELREETGLEAVSLTPLEVRPNPPGAPVLHVFSALVSGTPSGHKDPDQEASTWSWVDVRDGIPREIYDHLHGPPGDLNVVRQLLEPLGKSERVWLWDLGMADLSKATRRKRFPFNPDQSLDPDDEASMALWQGADREPEHRESIPYMGGPERQRALIKLAAATQTRRGPSGEAQYLLHRGVGPEERAAVTTMPGHVDYSSWESGGSASWTPRYSLARNFAKEYAPQDLKGHHILSAWIPEGAIHSIPKQYGAVSTRPGDYDEPKGRGVNEYAGEHEVVVTPHTSQLASTGEVGAAKSKEATLDQRISARAGHEGAGQLMVPSRVAKVQNLIDGGECVYPDDECPDIDCAHNALKHGVLAKDDSRLHEDPRVRDRAPEGLRSHPLFAENRTAALMSGENPRYPARASGHDAMGRRLQEMGLRAEPTSGCYGVPERSWIVHDPTREQAYTLGKEFGQEAVVYHAGGGRHEMLYTNGPHDGDYHPSLPAVRYDPSDHPEDYWTHLPGKGYFTLYFDDARHKRAEAPSQGQPMAAAERQQVAPIRSPLRHPHSYPWHDVQTHHHLKAPGPGVLVSGFRDLRKDATDYSGGVAHAQNQQAAVAGTSSAYHRIAAAYGTVDKSAPQADVKYYKGLEAKGKEVDGLLKQHGYQAYYAGGRHGRPDLAGKNYNTGHLMIWNPEEGSGGDFGHRDYTDVWRKSHELAHALTYPELNRTYGEGRRMGGLGRHRSTREATRAVHWEWLAAHKQRELLASAGVHISEPDFNRELNTVMHDAVHRAVTGKFTEPSEEGFQPGAHHVPLEHALGQVRAAAGEMGLKGADDLLPGRVAKSEPMAKAVRPEDLRALKSASDPRGPAVVDHAAEQDASPHARPSSDLYRRTVAGSGEVRKRVGTRVGSTGVSRKVVYKATDEKGNENTWMLKPYHDRPVKRTLGWVRYPIQGWAEMTTQALYHAGGIGHLHQDVHVAEHDAGNGPEPHLVVKLRPGAREQGEVKDPLPGNPWDPGQGPHHDVRRIALMDLLTGNLDRHGGNLMRTAEGGVLAVDHSRSFQYTAPNRNVRGTQEMIYGGPGMPARFVPVTKRPHMDDTFQNYHGGTALDQASPFRDKDKARIPGQRYDADLEALRAYVPAFEWWGEFGPKIREAMDRRLTLIKDSGIREHVKRNFDRRADWLDERAKFGLENFGVGSWDRDEVEMDEARKWPRVPK